MVLDLVGQMTSFLTPTVVAALLVALLIADLADFFSDSAHRLDLLVRTLITLGAGYLVITAGLSAL